MLRAIAKHADIASPMIDAKEARETVASYCREIGRDPSEIRWASGGGPLFLHDDPRVQEQALELARRKRELGARLRPVVVISVKDGVRVTDCSR